MTVALILLDKPSTVESTTDLSSVGEAITDPDQLTPSGVVYLEAWCQTTEPNGISTAVLDVTYETALLDTSIEQVTVASQWTNVFGVTSLVDDTAGLIKDLGGISFSGLGVEPGWAKIGTAELDVLDTPGLVTFCSHFAGADRSFGIVGLGPVPQKEVKYGCLTVGTKTGECTSTIECDDGDACTEQACNPTTGECEITSTVECDNADACTEQACDPTTGECEITNTVECDDGDPCTEQACNPATGKCETDTQLGLADYGEFAGCLTGPSGDASPDCGCADTDQDGDVDLEDFWPMQTTFDGSN